MEGKYEILVCEAERQANEEEVSVTASPADPGHSRGDDPRRTCSPAPGQRVDAEAS